MLVKIEARILIFSRHGFSFSKHVRASMTITHNWLFSEPPAFKRTQQTFSQMKKFCNLQVIVVTFSGEVGKWITDCFLLRT